MPRMPSKVLLGAALLSAAAYADYVPPGQPADPAPATAESLDAAAPPPLGFTVGVGIKVSTLGAGVEIAAPLVRDTNVRIGFNAIGVDHDFHKDGIGYGGKLNFASVTALLDWFPFDGNFHISSGFAYNRNRIKADASVPAGGTFSLDGIEYQSTSSDPVNGTARVNFQKIAPLITLGWGNLLPRRSHFSLSFELGALLQGRPRSSIDLQGKACAAGDPDCESHAVDVATDPTAQSNLQQERSRLDDHLSLARIYPVLSLGLGYRF